MSQEQHTVNLVSGETLTVLTDVEARWFTQSRDTYLTQTKFTETTDLRDLDRLLIQELMIFRLSQHLAQGKDYFGFDIEDDALLRRNIREYSEQITRLKSSMGLTKSARDEAQNSGDFSTWLTTMKIAAKEFGVHRENQLTKALVLMNELASIIGAYDRSDTEERQKLGFVNEIEIVEWVRDTMLPEFRAIDEHFRANHQKYWIRSM